MKILTAQNNKASSSQAFTLIEILVSMVIMSMMLTSLYVGISGGFAVIESARENLRATELIIERFEAIRLISWDQLNSGYISTNTFVERYDIQNVNSMSYVGKITIGPGPAGVTYADDMRTITVKVQWVSAGITHNRQMISYIARYGLQNYVY